MFRRVLVANRGEIAMRVIRACHELGVEAVAIYSTADRTGSWVTAADRAVCVGPPSATESYLKIPSVVAAAITTGCDAVHPGYGFLSENPAFVRACFDNDIAFVGPSPESMEVLGDKSLAKEAMGTAGLPLVPGSPGRLLSAREASAFAANAGFPVLLKAAAGGGGRGMRLVEDPDDPRGALRDRRGRGGRGVRRCGPVPREGGRGRAPRRGAGARRRTRRRARARRSRVLGPAPPPEADGGGAVAVPHRRDARAHARGCARGRPHDALPERRYHRVPGRARPALLLHGDEHPPPGRASRSPKR